jgi:hypothetical protein
MTAPALRSWMASDGGLHSSFAKYAARQCALGGWGGFHSAQQPYYYCLYKGKKSPPLAGQPPVAVRCPDRYGNPVFDRETDQHLCTRVTDADGICPLTRERDGSLTIPGIDPDCGPSTCKTAAPTLN